MLVDDYETYVEEKDEYSAIRSGRQADIYVTGIFKVRDFTKKAEDLCWDIAT